MSAHESDIEHWTDPKDYGLPFVKIIPIRSKEEPQTAVSNLDTETAIPVVADSPAVDVSASGELMGTVAPAGEPVKAVENAVPSNSSFGDESRTKQSSRWMWAVLVIAVGIVGVIVWQIQTNTGKPNVEPAFEIVEKPLEQPSSAVAEPVDSTIAEQNQAAVNQDSNQSGEVSHPNISKPAENGTTIANTATGNLIRVDSKTERAQYFIIVGSLPSERLALKEANQYFGRSAELYLISPFDGGKNYRLALSKFDNFKMAAARLEEIKSQYTEELWILKY